MVKVDNTPPVVECSVSNKEIIDITTTGNGVMKDVGLFYSASDNCQGPLNVTVAVYASERENFKIQDNAVFYLAGSEVEAELFLEAEVCKNNAVDKCIKDPVAPDARLYTIEVKAVDEAGNIGMADCFVKVVPQSTANKDIDTSNTIQRFHLTSFNSVFPATI